MSSSILPVHRPRQLLAFDEKIMVGTEPAPSSSNRFPGQFGIPQVKRLWKFCTSTDDGSISETFKLVTDDDRDSDAPGTSISSKRLVVDHEDDTFLEAVVVDNEEPHHHHHLPNDKQTASDTSAHNSSNYGGGNPRLDLNGQEYYQGGLRSWIRCRAWPWIVNFFEPRMGPIEEGEFQKQSWHSTKILAFDLILNWILYLVVNRDSTDPSLFAQYGGLTLFTVPTPFMVAFDMPRRYPVFFQIWFCVAVWYCAYLEVIQMHLCHFFTDDHCLGKTYLANSYFSTGLPALMMFIVSKRLYNFIAQFVFLALLLGLLVPDKHTYLRNVVLFALFAVFIQGLHYVVDQDRRRMFLLATQLKHAYKAKHKARLAESRASFTRRRFANYLFHEVRVPLNNAVLAFQLLQTGNAFKESYAKSKEIHALEQALNMMKTVLNDVLEMDAGHFDTIPVDQLKLHTDAKHLVLENHMDSRIDELLPLPGDSDEGLWIVGSELRLHQILNNLASNAVKYSQSPGTVVITTEFLGIEEKEELPGTPPDVQEDDEKVSGHFPLTKYLNFRMSVKDSGPGIKPSDLVEDRLFQPFIQTSVGQSSGSGTGLGLAIVKAIIKMSGGRLGVVSRRGEGSKFWIELSYPIATAEEIHAARAANTLSVFPGPTALSNQQQNGTRQLPSDGDTGADKLLSVLVVDDDNMTRLLSSKLLKKLGCEVETASDGSEFLEKLDHRTYDVVFLDNFMPMTGEEAVRDLRSNDRTDFVVGNALTEDQAKFREAGADVVLVKPVMIDDYKRILQMARQRRTEKGTRES
ncbi:hypothetical protein C8J56DRAFT_954366 [Mycena floridula]|nr:hypothetical protein C8J56DRAFT_954366 [Mycena floridula]